MSSWRDRAIRIDAPPAGPSSANSDWRSRATPVDPPPPVADPTPAVSAAPAASTPPPPTTEVPAADDPKPHKVANILRAITQGATLNRGDELVSAIETAPTAGGTALQEFYKQPHKALKQSWGNPFKLTPPPAPPEVEQKYQEALAENRPVWETAADDYPLAHMLGLVRAPLPKVGKGVKGAAGTGALGGAAVSTGASQEEDLAELAKESKWPAITGALAGGAFGTVGAGLSKFGGYLNKASKEQALKAIGATSKDIKELRNKGILDKVVDRLFKDKILGGTVDDISEKLSTKAQQRGQDIGKVLKDIDVAAKGPAFDVPKASKQVQDRLSKHLLPGAEGTPVVSPAMRTPVKAVERELAKIAELSPKQTFSSANKLKSDYAEQAQFYKGAGAPNRAKTYRDLYRGLNEAIETQVPEATKNPALLSKFKELKDLYGPLAQADDIAFSAAANRMANAPRGVTPSISGAIRQRLPSVSAKVSRALSKVLGPSKNVITGAETAKVLGELTRPKTSALTPREYELLQQLVAEEGKGK